MKNLNLEGLWQICNKLAYKQDELSESNIYVSLMGHRSNYGETSFENFLEYYSFKIDGDKIVVFNIDGVPYEDYSNDDFSYIPLSLLSFGEKDLEEYIETEIELELEKQTRYKLAEKESIKQQIENLNKRLNNL